MDALAFLPATELAARIRDGAVSAREAVEASRAPDRGAGPGAERVRRARRRARARRRRTRSRPGDERPFAGVPIAVKANTPVAGLCMNFGSRFLAGHRPTHSAYLVRRLRDGRLRGRRDDEHARVRDPADHRAAPHRPDAQPVGPDAHAGRLVGRLGRRGRRRAGARRARQRRRRLAADPRRLLRPRRAEAEPRPDLARRRTSATRSSASTGC